MNALVSSTTRVHLHRVARLLADTLCGALCIVTLLGELLPASAQDATTECSMLSNLNGREYERTSSGANQGTRIQFSGSQANATYIPAGADHGKVGQPYLTSIKAGVAAGSCSAEVLGPDGSFHAATLTQSGPGYQDLALRVGGGTTEEASQSWTAYSGESQDVASISGKVSDENGKPIEGVTVTAASLGGSLNQSTQTQSDGTYKMLFYGLPETYTDVRVSFSGYGDNATMYYNGKYVESQATLLTIAPTSVLTGIDAMLQSSAYVQGKVTQVDGTPISGVSVRIYNSNGTIDLTTETAATGTYQFRLDDLPPRITDTYIRFVPPDGYVMEYYDDKSDLASADAVLIGPGSRKLGIDAVIQARGPSYIKGRITDVADGTPLAGAHVEAGNGSVYGPHDITISGSDGSYILFFPDLERRYEGVRIIAEGAMVPPGYASDSTVAITLGPGMDLTGIDIALKQLEPAVVFGTVTDGSGSPMEGVTVKLADKSQAMTIGTTLTAPDGTYSLEVPTTWLPINDLYVEFLGSGKGNHQYYSGRLKAVDADLLQAAAGDQITGVDAVLANQGNATIAGKVTDVEGNPLSGIYVHADRLGQAALGNPDITAADGTYRIPLSDLTETYSDVWVTAEDTKEPPDWKIANAKDLNLGPGTSLMAINFELQRPGYGYISGRVTDKDGSPLEGVGVRVVEADAPDASTGAFARTRSDGRYDVEIKRVRLSLPVIVEFQPPPGYRKQYYNLKSSPEDADVFVFDQDDRVTGVDAALQESESTGPAIMEGMATDVEGRPIADVNVDIRVGTSWTLVATTSADGRYSAAVEPAPNDEVPVRFTPPDGYVKQFYRNERAEARADRVMLAGGETRTGIDAVLLPLNGARLSGTVTDETGAPVSNAGVSAYTQPENGNPGQPVGQTSTDSDGSYEAVLDLPNFIAQVGLSFEAEGYAAQFYKDKSTIDDADYLVVEQGDLYDNINAVLGRLSEEGEEADGDIAETSESGSEAGDEPGGANAAEGGDAVGGTPSDAGGEAGAAGEGGQAGGKTPPDAEDEKGGVAFQTGGGQDDKGGAGATGVAGNADAGPAGGDTPDGGGAEGPGAGGDAGGPGGGPGAKGYGGADTPQGGGHAKKPKGGNLPDGRAWGDVHLRTFDGARYDFHTVGEFVAVRSTVDDLEIQVRLAPAGRGQRASLMTAVAIGFQGNRASFVLDRDPVLWVNGEPEPLESGARDFVGGARLVAKQFGERNGYELALADSSTLSVDLHGHYLSAFFLPSDDRRGNLTGILGNYDGDRENDLVTADGRPIQRMPVVFEQLYGEFAPSWRLDQEASLFDYAPGESTETFTDLDYPSGAAAAVKFSEEERARAAKACEEAGVSDPDLLESCVFDVGITGDETYTEAAVAVQTREESLLERFGNAVGETVDKVINMFRSLSVDAPSEVIASYFMDATVSALAEADDQLVIAKPDDAPGKSSYHRKLKGGEEVVHVRLPNEPGEYELRIESGARPPEIKLSRKLIVRTPDARLEAPETATPGKRIAVQCIGECSSNANVTVVPAGSPDDVQGRKSFMNEEGMTIDLPKKKGAYEIRYVSRTNPRYVYVRRHLTIE